MGFPQNLDELRARGYVFENHSVCKDCGEDLEWWRTPSGKMLPFNPMNRGVTEAVLHMKTCSDRA